MTNSSFTQVIRWLNQERNAYQMKKFDYKEKDPNQTVDDWIRQFDSYIQRLPVFGLETPQDIQAAFKLAATSVALCEHLAAKFDVPMPGVPSGVIEPWESDV